MRRTPFSDEQILIRAVRLRDAVTHVWSSPQCPVKAREALVSPTPHQASASSLVGTAITARSY